jgi:hypothetical protein
MPNKIKRVESAVHKVYHGCGWLLINLVIMGFLCWTLYGIFVGYRVESNGETTEGHVVALDHVDGGTYSAIVEFEVNGQTYSLDDDSASNPPKYEIGENVTVRYDRSNPNIAHIDGVMPVWLFPSCMLIVILFVLIVVNILGWRAWKRGEDMIDLF